MVPERKPVRLTAFIVPQSQRNSQMALWLRRSPVGRSATSLPNLCPVISWGLAIHVSIAYDCWNHMIYRSNLTCPDLTSHFKHLHSRVMGHSMGHEVPSDWADKSDDDPVFGIYKRCGMFTHDEAAILYNVARVGGGEWCDIGAHTGWTSAHIAAASCSVDAVDPMLSTVGFQDRFEANMEHCWTFLDEYFGKTSQEFFELPLMGAFAGFCIDGDHEPGAPLQDAQNAAKHLAPTGVIVLHDGVGRPVREAVEWLMGHEQQCAYWDEGANLRPPYKLNQCDCRRGFKARAYFTPHLLFVCWRGDFVPPDHVPDVRVKRQHLDGRYEDFDFGRME